MEKVLTISIASYNVQEYLSKALDSLLINEKKVLDKLEVIIVNDGSKDDTLKIAKEYEKKYPTIFKVVDKKNGGYGSTINASLVIAKGKYYKLLDADDWFETGNLAEFIGFLEKNDTDVVLSQYFEYYEDNHKRVLIEQPYEYNIKLDVSSLTKYSMHALCIKTSCIQGKIQITENCFYTDSEFFIKCIINSNTFINIPLSIYCYRLGREGQSMNINSLVKHYDDYYYVAKKLLDLLQQNPKLEGMKKSIYSLLTTSFGYSLLLNSDNGAKNKFLECRLLIKEFWTHVNSLLTNKQKVIYRFPCFYYIVNIYLRNKKGITV